MPSPTCSVAISAGRARGQRGAQPGCFPGVLLMERLVWISVLFTALHCTASQRSRLQNEHGLGLAEGTAIAVDQLVELVASMKQ